MEWYTVDDYGEFIKLFGHRKIGQQTFHWGARPTCPSLLLNTPNEPPKWIDPTHFTRVWFWVVLHIRCTGPNDFKIIQNSEPQKTRPSAAKESLDPCLDVSSEVCADIWHVIWHVCWDITWCIFCLDVLTGQGTFSQIWHIKIIYVIWGMIWQTNTKPI